jgi:hypothetical protein
MKFRVWGCSLSAPSVFFFCLIPACLHAKDALLASKRTGCLHARGRSACKLSSCGTHCLCITHSWSHVSILLLLRTDRRSTVTLASSVLAAQHARVTRTLHARFSLTS